ncbi:MAG TPA: glycosyltransferase family 4 protein [Cryomorphaceae bacterium]|nr:glycosyltransferase family 4 protein [Cryomorphaceae bacterium]
MKNLLIITYYWPPAGGAGVQRWLKFSKYLPEFGWKPIILTVDPDRASYPQRDESLLKEVSDEVEVFRTNSFEPLQIYAKAVGKDRVPYGGFSNEKSNSSFSRFLRGNFFIPDARRGWNRYAIAKAREILASRDIDTIITTGPPQSTHLIGLSLKRQLGIKWGVDLRDPWTDIYYNEKMLRTPWAERRDAKLEEQTLRESDFCITVSNGFAELFNQKVKRKYHVITNGFDEQDLIEVNTGELQKSDKLIISYTGTISDIYQPDVFFQALSGFKDPFELRIAGSISEGVRKKIEEYGIAKSVNYLGYLTHADALKEMSRADLLLLISPKVKNSKGIIPGKLFEYLAFRKPILAIGEDEDGDIERILRETGAGSVFKRRDLEGMLKWINEINSLAIKTDSEVIEKYHRRNLTKRLVERLIKQ